MTYRVYEMHRTHDWILAEHNVIHEGEFIGYMIAYSPGQATTPFNHYDVWVVDNEQTLLLQFGAHEELNKTIAIGLVPQLARLANNSNTQLWANAYHMYLKRDEP